MPIDYMRQSIHTDRRTGSERYFRFIQSNLSGLSLEIFLKMRILGHVQKQARLPRFFS